MKPLPRQDIASSNLPSTQRARRRGTDCIELLEPRIAPAVLINPVNPRSATFTDVDGDLVTITVDRGNLANAVFNSEARGSLGGELLRGIDLTHASFAGTKLVVKAAPQFGNGDGFVAVGLINATGRDLTAVTIDGDLGALLAGDAVLSTKALGALTVHSWGAFGHAALPVDALFASSILGAVGSITVKTSITQTVIEVRGLAATDIAIGKLTVGGSLIGGANPGSGRLQVQGSIGTIAFGGSVIGGSGENTGTLFATGKIGALTIRGSVIGGAGDNAVENEEGQIRTYGGFGKIAISGSVIGGAGENTGFIYAGATLWGEVQPELTSGKVTIGGAVIARSQTAFSGVIGSTGNFGKISIGAGLFALENASARVGALGKNAGLTIGGSVHAAPNGFVLLAGGVFGAIKVSGSIEAMAGGGILIGAKGNDVSSADLSDAQALALSTAIKSITVTGSITGVSILAGYDSQVGNIINADVRIGPVKVGGDWVRSSLMAGVTLPPGLGLVAVGGGRAAINSTIASITVGGQMAGTIEPGDTYFLTAQLIGKLTIDGTVIRLLAGPGNDRGENVRDLGTALDIRVLEVL